MRAHSQRGVALVITLLLLSVITVIAVAFLALTRRERVSVTHSTYFADTELTVNSALERVKAEIVADILAHSNVLGPDFLVSVNQDGNTNNYSLATITNLLYDPRPPVFIKTNRGGIPAREFRYSIDLNRNGWFEQTGWQPLTNNFGQPILGTNNLPVTNFFYGDPQFIGILNDPFRVHAADNLFIGRYAYVLVPAGRTLDANFIHNNGKRLNTQPLQAGFYRSQGVGSWEINLAAFLSDLNTNLWGTALNYNYRPNLDPGQGVVHSEGLAFYDAAQLVDYRYEGTYQNLSNLSAYFDPTVTGEFTRDQIDLYADGFLPTMDDNDDPTRPWPGAHSPRRFFSLHDFWNTNVVPGYPAFVSRLREASETNQSTYDRTTFYRMLAQLGTDSAPEPDTGKIHLNYADPFLLTNWQPLVLFTNIAARLLHEEFRSGLTNVHIPVYTNGSSLDTNTGVPLYSPRMHQLIQIAANIVDATRGPKRDPAEQYPFFPSVYRPLFKSVGNDIFISGYEEVVDAAAFRTEFLQMPWYELDDPADRPDGTIDRAFFYNIPVIVAARKGFPNFNEGTLQTMVQVTRKLELRKADPLDEKPNEIRQLFIIGISNTFAVEAWNSYTNPYPRELQMLIDHDSTSVLTNDVPFRYTSRVRRNNFNSFPTNVASRGTWGGRFGTNFQVPFLQNEIVLSNSVYYSTPSPHFEPVRTNLFEAGGVYTNNWTLTVTNKLRVLIYDTDANQIVDVVALSGLDTQFEVSKELAQAQSLGNATADDLWNPRPYRHPDVGLLNYGVNNQLQVSMGMGGTQGVLWNSYGIGQAEGQDKEKARELFRRFMGFGTGFSAEDNPPGQMSAPFSPSKRMSQLTSWQVNDPLVHYTRSDLVGDATSISQVQTHPLSQPLSLSNQFNIGRINLRYKPWAAERQKENASPSDNDANPAVKDPGVTSSDAWDFPTNKFPTLGSLGRIHRATPWQTLYLKAGAVRASDWEEQVGTSFMQVGSRLPTAPTNDWRLVDLFTVAPHPNATRGTLSVNQEGLAAWSAVLSAMPVSTLTATGMVETIIQPAALGPGGLAVNPVDEIVSGINRQRARQPHKRFERLGDILGTRELTDDSPFLKTPDAEANNDLKIYQVTDADYERIPQQILSLLKGGDARYVVYAFGQSLKPAPNSVLASAPVGYPGTYKLCTNYQITGESAVRAVLRVDYGTNDVTGLPDLTKPQVVIESFNILPIE